MDQRVLRVLITGAQGFIGRNLTVRLDQDPGFTPMPFVRGDDPARLPALIAEADAVVHLAGENRPNDERAFAEVNTRLTATLCQAILDEFRSRGRRVPVILASSTQAAYENPYGRSKRNAENAVRSLTQHTGVPSTIFRLPGVFGKWSQPNYNSVVATFCYNIARGLPIRVDNPLTELRLAYVDDVILSIIEALKYPGEDVSTGILSTEYTVTLGDLVSQIRSFKAERETLNIDRVGTGLIRALYATYVSMLPTKCFSYKIPQHADSRGIFVEMLKTQDSGQFSYLTALPGITRGGHYHHTKTEKFLVIRGKALFRFRHLLTDERVELETSGDNPEIVETIPGWAHDITNIGSEEMIVILWANEVFDRREPDTIASRV